MNVNLLKIADRIAAAPEGATLEDLHTKFVTEEGLTEYEFFLAYKAAEVSERMRGRVFVEAK